jgi:serralysin
MKAYYRFAIILVLLSNSFLSACESNHILTPTNTPIPIATTTFTPTITPSPTHTLMPTSSPTPTANPIPMTCESAAVVNVGEFQAIMDDWGKGSLTGWSQCIGASIDTNGALVSRWTWDWLNSGGNVKSFPAIVFGQLPSSTSTSVSMPVKVNDIETAMVSYNVTSTHTGTGNLILHMWLTNTQNPTTWGVPPITDEIIIALEVYGDMQPAVPLIKQTRIDDISYDLFMGDHFGMGWRFIVFTRTPYQQGSGILNLVNFFSVIKKEGFITGKEYLASISIGNEVVSGTGETDLKDYRITVRQK